jgi:tRNA(fMet)-specific endonuclease VapC
MKYLLDTNVISELVAKRPDERLTQWIDQFDDSCLFISVITFGEIRKGIEKLADSRRKSALRNWLAADLTVRFDHRILPLDLEAMLTWGELTSRLERIGRPLSAHDSLIAAQALHHQCSLVTRNVDDFEGTGVAIVNPWNP